MISDRDDELLEQILDDHSVLQLDDVGETVAPGECEYCGCTHDNACVLEVDDPANVTQVRTCGWYRAPDHSGLGVCTNPECVKVYIADPGAR